MIRKSLQLSALSLALLALALNAGAGEFDSLKENQRLADFKTEAVYENEAGKIIGARFRHVPSLFVLDVLRIQSLPQAFMWVNSPPPSDQGEPHTLEHLLLGKGTKGRYVASLEDMSLGRSSAYTEQRRTCYHFNTASGADGFFKLFEYKLDAMINPNFSDEEIRREVCNMGVVVDQEDGSLGLEEKGTVYNEMVSSYERPWGNLYQKLLVEIYGEKHPLSFEAGGLPAAIREMTPQDIRDFHARTHHLNNMGAVVSIGDEVTLKACLDELSAIFERVEPDTRAGKDPATFADRLPKPNPAPSGRISLVHFPHESASEPGLLALAWPAVRHLSLEEAVLLELFMELLTSGQTSNLYRKFIDSQTRTMDIGAGSVFYWFDNQPGKAIFVGFGNVSPSSCDKETIGKVRALILDEIQTVADYADGSQGLEKFNERARNLLTQKRRSTRTFLNSPPRFGYRGNGSQWIDHLQDLSDNGGFTRNVALVDEYSAIETSLSGDSNFWKDHIKDWRLLSDPPYAAATTAGPDLLADSEKARETRIDDYVAGLRKRYGAGSDEKAIKQYRKQYDENTEAIDKEAATIEMPAFVDRPPLTNDDQLKFDVRDLSGGGRLVASTFENMTSSTVGFAFDLTVTPMSHLVYVPALPTLMRDVGVIKDGQTLAYDEFDEILRKEILELRIYFDVNYRTERTELALRGAGSELVETQRALEWLAVALFDPNLTEENLPRIRDAVDLELKSSRNRMRGSEESWVQTPVSAYWKQDNPLLMNADCFLTQTHALHRLRWLLKEAGGAGSAASQEFTNYMNELASFAAAGSRESISSELGAIEDGKSEADSGEIIRKYGQLSEDGRELALEAVKDLRLSLSEIPDGTLAQDIRYLTEQMVADLAVSPAKTLAEIRDLLALISHRDNVRAFVISSSSDEKALRPALDKLVERLAPDASERVTYNRSPLVATRLSERRGGATDASFVALVNQNTRSGVHVHTSNCASYEDRDEETLLKFLSARLYGGGGAHSMFMKTWGAGLAYSNGLRSNENRGRLIYYAERCPDLAQTLQFVVNELKNAPYDESLADYAVAQAFAPLAL
ncbi:MAG: M16 family metallopeptidase [Candidatus Zixiibacteriota bacterium]